MSVKKLNIDKDTCGKWKSRYILDILEKYPQINFQEWELLEMHHENKPNEIYNFASLSKQSNLCS